MFNLAMNNTFMLRQSCDDIFIALLEGWLCGCAFKEDCMMIKEMLLLHQNVKKVRDLFHREFSFNKANRNYFVK